MAPRRRSSSAKIKTTLMRCSSASSTATKSPSAPRSGKHSSWTRWSDMKTVTLTEWEMDVIAKQVSGAISSLSTVDRSRVNQGKQPQHTEKIEKYKALIQKLR